MVTQWLWLSLRYRSVTLLFSVNPATTSGGMVGKGKQEYFDCMGEFSRQFIAEYIVVAIDEASAEIFSDTAQLRAALEALNRAGLEFPLVAKPELG